MNNPNVIKENELARQKELEKLGLTPEQIEKNKALIAKVDEAKAKELGEELVKLIGKKAYNEEDDATYQKVLTLIKDGADLNFETEKGNFPLLQCARKNYQKTFITLLKFGANIFKVNKNETNVVMSSARHGNFTILNISILMGVPVNNICALADTALIMAKKHGMQTCFEILVKHNAILNIKNDLNLTSYDIKNIDGGANIDDSKYYIKVPTNVSAQVLHEDAMDLIYQASSELCAIRETLDIPTLEETPIASESDNQSQSTMSFDSESQGNININFKVR